MTDVYQSTREPAVSSAQGSFPQEAGAAETALRRRLEDRSRHRIAQAWTGTLREADMACLMAVLESQVLPRLIRAYRPADGLPAERCLG